MSTLDFVGGWFGGVAGTIVGYPLDTVKVLMQVQNSNNGMISCVKDIIAKNSIKGLFRGVTSPMFGVAFVNSISFGVNGLVLKHLNDSTTLSSHIISGAAAGFMQSFVVSPVELAKTRLQLGMKAKGPLACMKQIAKMEGYRALFRGLGMTMLRDTPAYATYFATYEALVRSSDGSQPSALEVFNAGGMAGVTSWIISLPMDSIKSRLQADGATGPKQYSGAYDCLRKSLKAEGSSFLFKGVWPILLRAYVCNAACFAVVQSVNVAYERYCDESTSFVSKCDVQYAAHAYKSLVFTSIFSETICPCDISELHEDFYHVNDVCRRCLLSIPVKLKFVKEVEVAS